MKQGQGVGVIGSAEGEMMGRPAGQTGWGRAFVAGRLGKGVLSEGPR